MTGGAIEGAQVTHVASGTSAITTGTGTVSLTFLPDGGGYVRVRKFGYSPLTQFIAISPRDTVPLTLLLVATSVTLPAVVTKDSEPKYISPGLRDFEERRKGGFGYFITEPELRKKDSRELPDVIRELPGVDVRCSTRTPRRCVALSARGCGYAIYWNGLKMGDRNLLLFNVSEFAGIEAYTFAATVPMQYNATGTCGVILLWSRER